MTWQKLLQSVCLLKVQPPVCVSEANSHSHGVTNATARAALRFSISHKASVYPVFTTLSHLHSHSLCLSPCFLSIFLFSLCHFFSNNGIVVSPASVCVTGVCVCVCVCVGGGSALAGLHMQVWKLISARLGLLVIGCLYPPDTNRQKGDDK